MAGLWSSDDQALDRRKAIQALFRAVGHLEPLASQQPVIDLAAQVVSDAYATKGKGAGQSTARMMAALRILEDDR